MNKIRLSIQEIVNDFYSLAEQEGYLTGLSEGFELKENDKKEYHSFMIKLMKKYLPNYKEHIEKEYFSDISEDEKGMILSKKLCQNFKHMFYQLI